MICVEEINVSRGREGERFAVSSFCEGFSHFSGILGRVLPQSDTGDAARKSDQYLLRRMGNTPYPEGEAARECSAV